MLLGFPQASTLGSPVGAWDVKAFQSTCKIAVMGTTSAGVSLALVTGTPLAQNGSLITLPATSYRLATDETHNRFLVAWFDATTGLTKFVTVNASTGVVANLNATTTFVVALVRISTDGATIQACGADTTLSGFPAKCQMIANN